MRIPITHSIIKRRILANYQVDPDILAKRLPPPFRPKIVNGVGMAGICLIRLEQIKPQFDGLELRSLNWKVEPLLVERIESSFFENQGLFPAGSIAGIVVLAVLGRGLLKYLPVTVTHTLFVIALIGGAIGGIIGLREMFPRIFGATGGLAVVGWNFGIMVGALTAASGLDLNNKINR